MNERDRRAFFVWAKWVDDDRQGPRPAGLPKRIPISWHVRYLLHRGSPPKPVMQPSLFSSLGGFVAQAGSFPPDTAGARAFREADGKWLAVQFGDPATDQGNRQQFSQGWAERWRQTGVKVGCWWRVEQVGIPIPQTPPVDFLCPNPEQPHEMERMEAILRECRKRNVGAPISAITLGKALQFPTGTLAEVDAHLILECFLETPASDTTVTNSVRYWLASQVELGRIHACLLHRPGPDNYPTAVAASEARTLGVHGLSSFTAENTPATAWKVMA